MAAAGSKKGKGANFVQKPKPITAGKVAAEGGSSLLGKPKPGYTTDELRGMAPGFKPRKTAGRGKLYQRPLTAADRTDVPFSGMTTNRTQEETGLEGSKTNNKLPGHLVFPGQDASNPLNVVGTMEEKLPTLTHPEGEEGDKSRARTASINETLARGGTIRRVARPEGEATINRQVFQQPATKFGDLIVRGGGTPVQQWKYPFN